jgi:hypothetical protein
VETIKKEKPEVVFAPHVETALGIIIPDDYIKSVAAEGFNVPGVVVSYTDDNQIVKKFLDNGIQIAAGVSLKCEKPENFQTIETNHYASGMKIQSAYSWPGYTYF